MVANTNVAFLKMFDDAFLCWSRLWPNNQKLLTILYQQVYKLVELTERWVCDNHIIIAIIYVLKTYALIRLWIVTTHTDRTESPFFCLVQQIVNELAFHPVHPLLYLFFRPGNIYILYSTFRSKQVTSQNIAFLLIDYFFVVTLIPVTWTQDALATQLWQIQTYLVCYILEQGIILIVPFLLTTLQSCCSFNH